MFSVEDIREIIQSFPPKPAHDDSPASLVLRSSGCGFITLQQLRADYESRIGNETRRVPMLQLAEDLDAPMEILRFFIRKGPPPLVFLSIDESEVIPSQETEAIIEKLRDSLGTQIIAQSTFEQDYSISFTTLHSRLWNRLNDMILVDNHICSRAYQEAVSEQARSIVQRAADDIINVELSAQDIDGLPGSPSKWFFLRQLQDFETLPEYADRVFVRETRHGIRVQSKQMRQRAFEEWSSPLLSGEIPYADIQSLVHEQHVYDSLLEATRDVKQLPGIHVVDTFAVSDPWIALFVGEEFRQLDEKGVVDIARAQDEKVGDACPASVQAYMTSRAEQHVTTTLAQRPHADEHHRYDSLVLTSAQFEVERDRLFNEANANAHSQWTLLQDNPRHELKPGLANSTTVLQSTLLKDKKLQKALDEHFWAAISRLEADNETAFATYWTEGVGARVHTYASALACVSDTKLQEQLGELLATYIRTELVPVALTKARSQGLVQSRRSVKNVVRLESAVADAKSDIGHVNTVLNKFAKKQALPGLHGGDDGAAKKRLLGDLHRRMLKSSSPPVLYLTLIVGLLAKHYPGVLYATGKFAPKLMKLLKEKVSDEEYARLEVWKEGAKTGEVGEEDRERMRAMVGEVVQGMS
ncbi:hypothetical protein ACEQ8H_007166 [Pleosporales sp. CAS-2024a]